MTSIKRPAVAASAAVLLAFSLTACGGPPTDASEDEFCEVVLEQPGDDVDAVHDWADKLEETGTPEDIPDDARNGFELLVDLAKDVDEDDINNLEEGDFSDDEQEDFAAYSEYVSETCFEGLEIPEDPTDIPTDVPTDIPTDIPTDVPTDIPTDIPTELSELTELPTTTS